MGRMPYLGFAMVLYKNISPVVYEGGCITMGKTYQFSQKARIMHRLREWCQIQQMGLLIFLVTLKKAASLLINTDCSSKFESNL